MSEKSPSKDEALEALDFIVNVLKEHEKDLDKLIGELGTVAGQLGEAGEINDKVKKIEDKINGLQNDLSNVLKTYALTKAGQQKMQNIVSSNGTAASQIERSNSAIPSTLPLIIQCSQWEEFRALAVHAQAASFQINETEGTLEISVLKNNQIVSFKSEIPELDQLVRTYLIVQLALPEKQIIQGSITIK